MLSWHQTSIRRHFKFSSFFSFLLQKARSLFIYTPHPFDCAFGLERCSPTCSQTSNPPPPPPPRLYGRRQHSCRPF
ncbi:hypothetical protein B0H13DRAFT_1969511 [Mycena leptocephala]|nr:hypothetical protein B0H13DRAFT_1969511 [Mycena leptocephala]